MARLEEDLSIQRINGERRGDWRYRLGLDLRWNVVRRGRVFESGIGRTVDLSSGGILFDAGRQLPAGAGVEISIEWPALLHDVAPMRLVVSGRIVRAEGSRAAVRVSRHEFRSADVDRQSLGSGVEPAPPAKFGTLA